MYVPLAPAQTSMFPLASTNTMPAFEPELTMPYRVLLGRSPLGMGPNRRELPLYVMLHALTMTTLPLTTYNAGGNPFFGGNGCCGGYGTAFAA